MKSHCYCNMLSPKNGTMVEANDATYVRDGIPICGTHCVEEYNRRMEQREAQKRIRRAFDFSGV